MPKIYTKSGDKGFTRKYTGEKISKHSSICDAVGLTDNINVSIGAFKALLKEFRDKLQIKVDSTYSTSFELLENIEILTSIISEQERIQRIFLNIASDIASTRKSEKSPYFSETDDEEQASRLEHKIDRMTSILPKLTVFILMGESVLSTSAHRCRVDVRQFERKIVECAEFDLPYKFVNRLSDYYFQLGRYVDYIQAITNPPDDNKYRWWGDCFDVAYSCISHVVCIYIGSYWFG